MNIPTYKKIVKKIGLHVLVLSVFGVIAVAQVSAQSVPTLSSPVTSEDPTQTGFRVVVCDGPHNPKGDKPVDLFDTNGNKTGTRAYVVCDFNGAMMTVQHLINIAMVMGVFAAVVLFTYAGFLMLKGDEKSRGHAKEIFPKVFWGFVIMLSAWFIVYQILNWLTGNSAFTKLLGNP